MIAQPSTSTAHLPRYVSALRYRPQLWRTLTAAAGGIVALLALISLAVPVGAALDGLLNTASVAPGGPTFTIGLWIAGNVLIALLIPISMALQALAYGRKAPGLSSVGGGFRWSLLVRAGIVVIPLWVAYTFLMQPLLGTGVAQWRMQNVILVLVAVITIPLQSAGEEYLFRGLIFRAVGARFARPTVAFIVATTVTALEFGLVHGAADLWAVMYYVAMGASFAILTERTGGLEVAVLIHATNNTALLIPVILAGELSSVSAPTGPIVLIPIVIVAGVTFVLWKMTPWLTRSTSGKAAEE